MVNIDDKNISRSLSILEKAGLYIYQAYYRPKEKYSKIFDEDEEALFDFLEFFAYQRQGAAAAYPQIAIQAIKNSLKNGSTPICDLNAKKIWEDYKEIAQKQYDGLGVNETRNPMSDNGGIIIAITKNNINNIAKQIRDLLENKKTIEAYNLIRGIRGIGEKIASFYIRDVAYLANLNESEITDLYLLQPVDTWIRQVYSIIFGKGHENDALTDIQENIISYCRDKSISTIAFNQGAWALGSQIAQDYNRFQESINDINKTKKMLQERIKEHLEWAESLKNFLNKL